ncbi:hypothetical protein QQS21_008680 [Conoideocrella luteorostrata]|uniref:Extracellular serine-rich protein n=1 Tax=Conoideocrella luteorostrata TaxID=1105319 RepID=A0AAJ0CL65_9HYPO|nr:hypothetical protein QQS21_008680 [Conoideocrella luteorostrata]
MHFIHTKAAALSLLAACATAKTIKIDVGSSGLTFSPDSTVAEKGDILEFHFYSVHSVAMGDFANGCAPAAHGGFFSGVIEAEEKTEYKDVFQVTVNNTDPMAFYCTVPGHCQNGMVGVVNPSPNDSLLKYKNAVKRAKGDKPPSAVFGGKLVASSGSGSTSSTMPSGTSSSTAGGMTTGTPTSPRQTSGTASASQTSSTAAATQMHASLGGLGAVALGFAAFLV